jgi:hypothetical protein
MGAATKEIRDWTIRDHRKHWDSFSRQKQAKTPIQGPSANKTTEMLQLNSDQLRWVLGLLTGHWHLKGHLFNLGLANSPRCKRCIEKEESATHILCDCEKKAYLRFYHMGHYFMEPSDYYDAPIRKVLCIIRKGSSVDLRYCSARAG